MQGKGPRLQLSTRVGESLLDEELGRRIDAAAETAQYPWQFCFVLGGGWRRTAKVADACRANNAELVVAAVAALQLVSRDAPTTVSELVGILSPSGLSQVQVETAVRWLVSQRTLISGEDLRCPHQRFSAAVLGRIFAGLDKSARGNMQRLCRDVLANSRSTIAGCRIFIHELNFSGQAGLESQRWVDKTLVSSVRLDSKLSLIEICDRGCQFTPWNARDPILGNSWKTRRRLDLSAINAKDLLTRSQALTNLPFNPFTRCCMRR